MNIGSCWIDPFIKAVAYNQELEVKSMFQKLKKSLILLLDEIFAALSASYQTRRLQVFEHLKGRNLANQDLNSEDEKAQQIFQNVQNAEKTINDLVQQGLQDEEIITIMKDTIPADRCREIIVQSKKLLLENNSSQSVTNREETKTKEKSVYPDFIFAANGVNQYQIKRKQSACTPLVCQFLASKEVASSQMIEKLILENDYLVEEHHALTEETITKFELKIAENPWDFQREISSNMQVNFSREGKTGIDAAIKTLVDSSKIKGAIFTALGVSVAMRKWEDKIEFFDSHGGLGVVTEESNAAYICIFPHHETKEMGSFLLKRFPDTESFTVIEVWPIE